MFSCILISDKSFSINFILVVGGLQTFFLSRLLQAFIESFLCWSIIFRRLRWSSQFNCLFLIVVLHGSASVVNIVHHY